MTRVVTGAEQLKRLFAALTEQTFQVQLGVADPPLIDYLAELLLRFVRMESVFSPRDIEGRRLEEVADMLAEAEQREAHPRREIHRTSATSRCSGPVSIRKLSSGSSTGSGKILQSTTRNRASGPTTSPARSTKNRIARSRTCCDD